MDASLDGDMLCTIFGHCDLDLVSRTVVSGAYLIYYLRKESQIFGLCIRLCVTLTLTLLSGLIFFYVWSIILYITNNFPQICLINARPSPLGAFVVLLSHFLFI